MPKGHRGKGKQVGRECLLHFNRRCAQTLGDVRKGRVDYIRKAVEVCGSNQKEIVRTSFYALYPSDDKEAKRKAFNRGWSLYFDSLVTES